MSTRAFRSSLTPPPTTAPGSSRPHCPPGGSAEPPRARHGDEIDVVLSGAAGRADDSDLALVGPDLDAEVGRSSGQLADRGEQVARFHFLGMVEDAVPEVEDAERGHCRETLGAAAECR